MITELNDDGTVTMGAPITVPMPPAQASVETVPASASASMPATRTRRLLSRLDILVSLSLMANSCISSFKNDP
jgi:hypothetical protein